MVEDHPVGRCFYGRLAPVDDDPRRCFAMMPTIDRGQTP